MRVGTLQEPIEEPVCSRLTSLATSFAVLSTKKRISILSIVIFGCWTTRPPINACRKRKNRSSSRLSGKAFMMGSSPYIFTHRHGLVVCKRTMKTAVYWLLSQAVNASFYIYVQGIMYMETIIFLARCRFMLRFFLHLQVGWFHLNLVSPFFK